MVPTVRITTARRLICFFGVFFGFVMARFLGLRSGRVGRGEGAVKLARLRFSSQRASPVPGGGHGTGIPVTCEESAGSHKNGQVYGLGIVSAAKRMPARARGC